MRVLQDDWILRTTEFGVQTVDAQSELMSETTITAAASIKGWDMNQTLMFTNNVNSLN